MPWYYFLYLWSLMWHPAPQPTFYQPQYAVPTISIGGAYRLTPINPGNVVPPVVVYTPPCHVIQPGLSVCS